MKMSSLNRYGMIVAALILGVSPIGAAEKPDKAARQFVTPECSKELATQLDKLAKSEDPGDVERFKQIGGEIERLQVVDKQASATTFNIQRAMKTRLLLRTLAALSARIDPHFDADDVPRLNIAPPDSNLPAGVSPKGIKDLAVRRKYEAAIQKNKEKAQRYNLQTDLRKLRDRYPKSRLFQFVQLHFDDNNPQDRQELAKLLDAEIKDKELRKWLEGQLEELAKKYYVQPGGAIIRRAPKP